MSDEARQTQGEPVSPDPWAPPEDRAPQAPPAPEPTPTQAAQPADAAPGPEVSLTKQDPWAPPADSGQGGAGVHDQHTVAAIPGAPAPGAAPADPWQQPAAPAQATPGYGYPATGDAVPPPPVSPDGPGQPAASPYGYPSYPGYPGAAGGYGWAQMPPQASNGMGITALVLGIVSAVIFCLWPVAIIVGVLAIVFGALGRAKARRGEATNPGQALAGLICGIVGVVLALGLLVLAVVGSNL